MNNRGLCVFGIYSFIFATSVAMLVLPRYSFSDEFSKEVSENTPEVVDFTPRGILKDVPGTVPGGVSYHGTPRAPGTLEKTLKKTPDGGHVLWDAEPWNSHHEGKANYRPWYGKATEEENAKLFGEYARSIWKLAPELRRRNITLYVYSTPINLQRNWFRVWRGESHPNYRAWKAKQLEIIDQAERSGMLSALRACHGKVAIVLYVPPAWDEKKRHKWTLEAMPKVVKNLHGLLEKHNVPHLFLIRADNSRPMLEATIQAAKPHGLGVWFFHKEYDGDIVDVLKEGKK